MGSVVAVPGRAWGFGFGVVLAGVMAVGTSANAVIPVLAPVLVRELGIDRAGVGSVVSVVGLGGALVSVFAGALVDRLGGRRLALGILGAGTCVLALTAMSRSLGGLLVAGVVCGLANGASNPATNELIATRLPRGRQGITTGVKQSGVYGAVFLAGLGLPPLVAAFGWRIAVWITLAVPVGLALLTLIVVPPDSVARRHAPAGRVRFRAPASVVWMTVYGFFMGMGAGAMLAFIPLYAQEGVGLSVQAAGLVASTFGILGIAARILWARGSERLADYARPLRLLALLSALAAGLVLIAAPERPWLLWVGVVLAGATVTAWNAVAMLAVVVRAPGGQTGRASGLVTVGFLSGLGSAPPAFGAVVDRTGSYDLAWGGVIAVLLVAALTATLWRRQESADGAREREVSAAAAAGP